MDSLHKKRLRRLLNPSELGFRDIVLYDTVSVTAHCPYATLQGKNLNFKTARPSTLHDHNQEKALLILICIGFYSYLNEQVDKGTSLASQHVHLRPEKSGTFTFFL